MNGHGWVGLTIVFVFLLSFAGRAYWAAPEDGSRPVQSLSAGPGVCDLRGIPGGASPIRRIVSLAPSITETLFALGVGDRVVGVSRFCDWPTEVHTRAQIGGLFDPNLEAIVLLQPDLVVGLDGQPDTLWPMRKLGLPLVVVDHRSIEGLLDSIRVLGSVCGVSDQAESLFEDIHRRLEEVSRRVSGRPRPRVLIIVQRTVGVGRIENIYIAGQEGHLSRIVELAGGENAAPAAWAAFPIISAESLLRLDPDVILDLVPGFACQSIPREEILADWNSLSELRAVRQARVYLLDEDFVFRPGPRFILFVEKLSRLLHPEEEAP